MVSKIMPDELHGTFFGTQAAAYNGMAGLSAILAGLILAKIAGPLNFSLCFALTFVWMAVSFVFLSVTREPESQPRADVHRGAFWKRSVEILKSDSNFRSFLFVRVLSQFAGMGFAFYVIYAVKQFGMSEATASAMVSVLLIGQIVLSPVMGRWGDRWSHGGVMALGALGAAFSAFLCWQATSVNWFYAIFLLEAAAIVAIWTIPLAFSVSFARMAEDRPIYIGLANTVPAPATILAPVLGGWLADTAGFDITFMLSAASGLLMAAALWLFVRDPSRNQ
jgi:MFS family permease